MSEALLHGHPARAGPDFRLRGRQAYGHLHEVAGNNAARPRACVNVQRIMSRMSGTARGLPSADGPWRGIVLRYDWCSRSACRLKNDGRGMPWRGRRLSGGPGAETRMRPGRRKGMGAERKSVPSRQTSRQAAVCCSCRSGQRLPAFYDRRTPCAGAASGDLKLRRHT